MTEDYKLKLLKYLTGTLPSESGVNEPQLYKTDNTISTLQQFIYDNGYPQDTDTLFYYYNVSFYYQRNNKYLLFYTCFVNNEDYSINEHYTSFIMICDKDLNPEYIIKQFSSGTDFRVFSVSLQNDIGAGTIYFMDQQQGVAGRRLCMINDPTLIVGNQTEYEVRMLSSFNVPNITSTYSGTTNFYKNEEEGKYCFLQYNYVRQVNGAFYYKIAVVEFVNIVGQENEWNTYTYSNEVPHDGYEKLYPLWNETGFSCRLLYANEIATSGKTQQNLLGFKTNNVDDVLSLVVEKTFNLPSGYYVTQLSPTMQNYNTFYITTFWGSNEYDINATYVLKGDYNAGTLTTLVKYENPYNSSITYNVESMSYRLYAFNNEMFFMRERVDYTDQSDYTTFYQEYYFGRLLDTKFYEIYIDTLDGINSGNIPAPFITKEFNLYRFKFIKSKGNIIYNIYNIFNVNNYNGLPFTDVNSLISNQGVLYGDNPSNPIFARNLYNRTLNANKTTSVLNVPNTYLNDTTIEVENLWSKNNNIMINSNVSINKNIYEDVLLNFISTLNIINNNESAGISNLPGAIYLNNAINDNIQYNVAKMVKLKITYTDGTSTVEILDVPIIYENEVAALYSVAVFSPKGNQITKLEFVSEDESIVYQTIIQAFKEDTYYKIKQRVRVE